MENEYYALKSLYEADMVRLGQPVPGYSTPVSPIINDGEIIYEGPGVSNGSTYGGGIVMDSNARRAKSPVELAGHIRSIEINQLAAQENETARLLVRPLDDQGAILPVSGDIKLRLYEPASGKTIFENEYSSSQVSGWISDQPGQQPGIHVSVPMGNKPGLSDRLVCDLQYRTADNRILKQSMELVFADQAALQSKTASRAQPTLAPVQPRTRNASAPLQPEGIDGTLEIQIGDELNFESLDDAGSGTPPQWRPDR